MPLMRAFVAAVVLVLGLPALAQEAQPLQPAAASRWPSPSRSTR